MPMGMIVESAVAILLAVTIGYCFVLNRKLTRLHSDREALKQMVADLVQSTDLANRAIGQLREAATEADAMLTARLDEAERFGVQLANHVNAGQAVMERIARITDVARKSQELAPAPQPRGAQAALKQLSEHVRRRESAA